MNIINRSKPAHNILSRIKMVIAEISEDTIGGSKGGDRAFIPPGNLWLFFTVVWVGLQCVIVVFPDRNHLHFFLLNFSIEILARNHLRSNCEIL